MLKILHYAWIVNTRPWNNVLSLDKNWTIYPKFKQENICPDASYVWIKIIHMQISISPTTLHIKVILVSHEALII